MRSGTTLLRLLLGHHPAICRCEEFEFVTPAIAGRADWPDLEGYRYSLQADRAFLARGLRVDPTLDFPSLARDFLHQLGERDGRPIIGAAVHNHFNELGRIWPGAKYIHLVRDPRDVARSCVQMGWAGNAWGAAVIWRTAYQSWLKLRRSLPTDRFIEVRFETLIADTEGELARIARFLGTEFDPAMLELEADTTYRRPDPGAAKSWRTDAPRRDVQEVEAALGPLLVEAGYQPSGLPLPRIGPWRSFVLMLEHRFGRMRFGQRRYGMGLWLGAAIARRLPSRRLQHQFQRRFNRIDEQHLQ